MYMYMYMYIVTLHLLNFLSFLICIVCITTSTIFPKFVLFFIILVSSCFFSAKCIHHVHVHVNPIVVSSISLVTNSIDNCDKKMFWNTLFVVMVVICTQSNQPWFTKKLKTQRQRTNRLYVLHRKEPLNDSLRAAYKLSRNLYHRSLRAAKDTYLSTLGYTMLGKERKGGYAWWKRAKAICNIDQTNRKAIPDLQNGNEIHKTDQAKAETLCTFFARQCTTQSTPPNTVATTSSITINEADVDGNKFGFGNIRPVEVFDAAKRLQQHKSSSDINLTNRILKQFADILSQSLSVLFNYSLDDGVFPSSWKSSTVIPVYKNRGCAKEPTNYRPISLLPCIAKLMEKILSERLLRYLMTQGVICKGQFAYVRNKSVTDQLILLTQSMAVNIDNGTNFDLISLDFRKAFDRVDHSILLKKFGKIATASSVKWLKSFLGDRQIEVKVHSTKSKKRSINCGVPHLSPLLFLLYINDLPNAMQHCTQYLFADDVTLLLAYKPEDTLASRANMQSDLDACQTWGRNNGGEFSASKTSVLCHRAINDTPTAGIQYQMYNEPLTVVSELQHLGITLTDNLDFRKHVASITSKFRYRVHLLSIMSQQLTPSAMIILYKGFVRPVIEYSCTVWSFGSNKKPMTTLDQLQARFARALLKKKKIAFDYTSSKSVLNSKCSLESLAYRRQIISLTTFHRYVFHHRDYLADFHFKITNSERRPNKIILPKFKSLSKSLFMFRIELLFYGTVYPPPPQSNIGSLAL